jgi:transaldolase
MLNGFTTKIFADGADFQGILGLAADSMIDGFTTNPTLMRNAGVSDYESFARDVLSKVTNHPISFEVFADDLEGMRAQAERISRWGENVYVKIPVTNTKGESTVELVRQLSGDGVKLNVTAIFTTDQVRVMADAVRNGAPSNLSVFAGRIADAGVDPVPVVRECLEIMSVAPNAECIWASPREVLNFVQADQLGCHIITMTHDLLKKLGSLGKSLEAFSLETVQMFHRDASTAGYDI